MLPPDAELVRAAPRKHPCPGKIHLASMCWCDGGKWWNVMVESAADEHKFKLAGGFTSSVNRLLVGLLFKLVCFNLGWVKASVLKWAPVYTVTARTYEE